jgi:hypothetical protein
MFRSDFFAKGRRGENEGEADDRCFHKTYRTTAIAAAIETRNCCEGLNGGAPSLPPGDSRCRD